MPSFSDDATPKAMLERLNELAADPKILTLKYIMGDRLFIEWAHSLGILYDKVLSETVPRIPPLDLRSLVAASEEEFFLWTGFVDAQNFYNLLFEYLSVPENHKPRILDFGCGCGRMTRYFDMISSIETYGSDVNSKGIEWCRANLANVISIHNSEQPPLPFAFHFYPFKRRISRDMAL